MSDKYDLGKQDFYLQLLDYCNREIKIEPTVEVIGVIVISSYKATKI